MAKRDVTLEFLPAALEVEQTPPRGPARAVLWSIVVLFSIAVLWACLGYVDIVAVAQGKIVPLAGLKTVQPIEAAIVKAVRVTEGQRVAAGDVLIELDDTKMRADLARLTDERRAAAGERRRLQRQLAALHRYGSAREYFDRDENHLSTDESIPARVTSNLDEHFASTAALDEQLAENRAERAAAERRIDQLNATLPLIAERVAAIGRLEQQSLAPRAMWLELQEQRVAQEKSGDVLRAQLLVSDAAYRHLLQRRDVLHASTRSNWMAELADTENRLKAYEHEVRKATARVREMRLTAPVAGTVQQLAANTVGGVVRTGEHLMLIVPAEDALRVEAWIANKDIGFVNRGQAVEIKVETFPFTKYGVIHGDIVSVSDDAIVHDDIGLVYGAEVRMAQSSMQVRGRSVGLTPGMAVIVEVKIGKRRLIEFLLGPLLRYRDEAMQER